jgi:hypothetical protein
MLRIVMEGLEKCVLMLARTVRDAPACQIIRDHTELG